MDIIHVNVRIMVQHCPNVAYKQDTPCSISFVAYYRCDFVTLEHVTFNFQNCYIYGVGSIFLFSFSHLEDAFVINELKIRNSDDFLLQIQAVEVE